MNVVTRGVKNAVRGPIRSGLIVLMLAISIGLVLAMLVAHGSVESKIKEVKASAGTKVTISAAGIQGFQGGGNPLTAANVTTIKNTAHVSSVVATLSDQLSTDDTNLTASLSAGSFGNRQAQIESGSSSSSTSSSDTSGFGGSDDSSRPAFTPRITVTGTTDPNSVATNGGTLTIKSGSTFTSDESDNVALVGSDLATKNNLKVGDTFTAYSRTITVKGIYSTGSTFTDSNLIMPLATVQTLSDQAGDVTTVTATVDSSDNVNATVTKLKSELGSSADITSEVEQAQESVSALSGIASLSLAGVIGAAIAGAAIILLAMIIVVRERKREIGVIKAIGGTNGKVVGQFVVESLTLTVAGAIVGLIFGVLVSGPMTSALASSSSNSSSTQTASGSTSGISRSSDSSSSRPTGGFGGQAGGAIRGGFNQVGKNFTAVKATLTPQIFGMAVGITLVVALLGSILPAWFIARIRPAEVLRSE